VDLSILALDFNLKFNFFTLRLLWQASLLLLFRFDGLLFLKDSMLRIIKNGRVGSVLLGLTLFVILKEGGKDRLDFGVMHLKHLQS
jgi:hypothetical protein